MTTSLRLPHDFSESAAYPLYAIDPAKDRAWVLHFTHDDYRRASFLDHRALQHREISGWTVTGEELELAIGKRVPATPLHWLFHIGHCGSTLVSRLLDLIPGTLVLREPLPVLALTEGHAAADRWLPTVRCLLRRGFADTEAVIVKPTSIVTTLAQDLLADNGQACLLWVDLHTWLATMLRSGRLVDSTLATERLRVSGIPIHGPAGSIGPRLARLWLAEQLRWHHLGARPDATSRLVDLDFADVLADPAGATHRLAKHFGFATPEDWGARIATSGLLDRYAKDATQRFDSAVRRRELEAAARQHSAEIEDGLQWARDEIEAQGPTALLRRLQPRD